MALIRTSGIYKIDNLATRRFYIGSAISLPDREYHHRYHLNRGSHKNPRLQSSWKKHGEAAFAFRDLAIVFDPAHLIPCEQVWIDLLDATLYGYNVLPTAGSSLGVKFSDDARAKVSAATKIAMSDPAVKARHRAATLEGMATAELRSHLSAVKKAQWADPEYRSKMLAAFASPECRNKQSMAQRLSHLARKASRTPEQETKLKAAQAAGPAKAYTIVTPEGETLQIRNLKAFCKERGLCYGFVCATASGRYATARGYRVRRT